MEKNANGSDYSQLRAEVTKKLGHIAKILEHDIASLEQNDIQILSDLEEMSKGMLELESITSTYFLNSLLSEYTCFSKELSRTVHKLSLKGQGALIVIEKTEPVAPFVKGGTFINAQISSQLLESIFLPESQLHEGAVLIRADMIIAASMELPVTGQIFWDRIFNIRELSAIGLSEKCDALILLVAEDGSTSFCLGGNMFPFSTT